MGTGANPWRYVYLLIDDGYKLEFDSSWSVAQAIEVKLTKGIYHAKYTITRKSLERNMLGDDLLMYEILHELREMVDGEAKKGYRKEKKNEKMGKKSSKKKNGTERDSQTV